MTKLYVVCGHGAGDPGACAGGYTEAERVRALGQRIKELGGYEVVLADTSRNWYEDTKAGGGFHSIAPGCPVVELHMDASGVPNAKGAHIIIKEGFDADDHDEALAKRLAELMPGRSERIVKTSGLLDPNVCGSRGIDYRLAENGFIDSPEDLAIFSERLDELARIYLEVFGITASSAPAPSTQAQPAPQETTEDFGGKYRCTVSALNVRDAPSLGGNVVASYSSGQTVVLDDWYKIADGYVWGRYTSYSGHTRYVAVGKATGKPEADDFLVKA